MFTTARNLQERSPHARKHRASLLSTQHTSPRFCVPPPLAECSSSTRCQCTAQKHKEAPAVLLGGEQRRTRPQHTENGEGIAAAARGLARRCRCVACVRAHVSAPGIEACHVCSLLPCVRRVPKDTAKQKNAGAEAASTSGRFALDLGRSSSCIQVGEHVCVCIGRWACVWLGPE